MRKLARVTPPETIAPLQPEDIITETREYTLITPLFGGGAEPSAYDPITVVRATEIRGQLRFWWRACRGANTDADVRTMKEREDAIWGKAAQTDDQKDDNKQNHIGSLDMTVQIVDCGESVNPFNILEEIDNRTGKKKKKKDGTQKYIAKPNKASNIHPYAAFPLQPSQDDLDQDPPPPPKVVRKNVRFTLTLRYPSTWTKDLQAALWAWENFGGLGARTRRGFGALHLDKLNNKINTDLPVSKSASDVRRWINQKLIDHVANGNWLDGTPHLTQHAQFYIASSNKFQDPVVVWYNLIKKLHDFRQGSFGRGGRSLWPEAEAIRVITGRRHYPSKHHPQKFPRAAFGLPIGFHFKDSDEIKYTNPDPFDTTLQGASLSEKNENSSKNGERFASPLILRPLLCNDEYTVGIALLLDGTHLPPNGLILRKNGSTDSDSDHAVDAQLVKEDLKQLSGLNLQGQTDILQAFMQYLGGIIK